MLDMAFQLLAFFILTFKAPSAETHIDLYLPATPAALPSGPRGQARPSPSRGRSMPTWRTTCWSAPRPTTWGSQCLAAGRSRSYRTFPPLATAPPLRPATGQPPAPRPAGSRRPPARRAGRADHREPARRPALRRFAWPSPAPFRPARPAAWTGAGGAAHDETGARHRLALARGSAPGPSAAGPAVRNPAATISTRPGLTLRTWPRIGRPVGKGHDRRCPCPEPVRRDLPRSLGPSRNLASGPRCRSGGRSPGSSAKTQSAAFLRWRRPWPSTPEGDLFCTVFPDGGSFRISVNVTFTGRFLRNDSLCRKRPAPVGPLDRGGPAAVELALAPPSSEPATAAFRAIARQSGTGMGTAYGPAVRVVVTGGLDAGNRPGPGRGCGAGLKARSPAFGGQTARTATQELGLGRGRPAAGVPRNGARKWNSPSRREIPLKVALHLQDRRSAAAADPRPEKECRIRRARLRASFTLVRRRLPIPARRWGVRARARAADRGGVAHGPERIDHAVRRKPPGAARASLNRSITGRRSRRSPERGGSPGEIGGLGSIAFVVLSTGPNPQGPGLDSGGGCLA